MKNRIANRFFTSPSSVILMFSLEQGICEIWCDDNKNPQKIAIHPAHRGKHLACSIGARFVLECQKRKLYPWWDCANPTSEHIAKRLGYFLKQENCTYKMQLRNCV